MTALELVSFVTQAIYILIFAYVAWTLLRRPTRSRLDMTLFFGVIAAAIIQSRVLALLGIAQQQVTSDIAAALVLAMPYFLLRLVSDFTDVPALFKRGAELGLVAIVVALIAIRGTLPPLVVLALVAYFGVVSLYCAQAFVRAARRSTGVTRRRMQAVAAGSLLLGVAILVAGIGPLSPVPITGLVSGITQVLALASAVAYFIGFATPQILRRAWQQPELRAFLRRAASLPRLPDTGSIVRALQEGAAATLGARAAIGLHDRAANVLRFQDPSGVLPDEVGPGDFLVWRAFAEQRPEYYPDAGRAHPELGSVYRARGIASLLIAPISAGEKRLGALEAYAEHPPIFSEDDLELVVLLADQAAVVLESRALIDEAARVRAHEEAARLKEDFISAAAHDLKTPLTTLVAQAQFLERRAESEPGAPTDLQGIKRIVREAKRLSSLVVELLDAARLEQGKLIGEREPVDLVELAQDVASRETYRTHRLEVAAAGPVVGSYDPRRIGQVIENLVENAVKYSPEATAVRIGVSQSDGHAHVQVSDEGIGIPPEELSRVFDRFHRGSNVDDRRFAGMGLGLFICRGIVEQHGGRIWVESRVGTGSTFHVTLPVEVRR